MFIATSSPEISPAPEGRNVGTPHRHSALPGLGRFLAGRGYKHGAPTELTLNGAQLAIP